MAVYSVEGKLGTGKTKFCVWQAQNALRDGRRVASNVDLFLEHLVPEMRGATYLRIPDKPTAADLESIGHGNPESYDEDRNGVLILDELGSWLNARSFQDKSRHGVIDWLIHARKLGWNVYLIVQDALMIDKQVRDALIEYQCRCVRLDKVRIPVFGKLLGLFNKKLGYLPRLHNVTARVIGSGATVVAERWHFRGDDLHEAYDTRQIFKASDDGTYTVWHPGRYGAVKEGRAPWWRRLLQRRAVDRPAPAPLPERQAQLVKLLRSLPEAERVKHFRRLQAAGAF
jgi:hypothetical protein